MDTFLADFLNKSLSSKPIDGTGKLNPATFTNKLKIPIKVYILGDNLSNKQGSDILFTDEAWTDKAPNYLAYLITTPLSGAIIGIGTQFDVNKDILDTKLTKPNDIGSLPAPSSNTIIPTSSPHILIGYGFTHDGHLITREQYWEHTNDSFTLAAGETRSVGITTTVGVQSTTEERTTLAAALGVDSSIGWGNVSASISASLNMNSSTFNQITLSTKTSRYENVEILNKSKTNLIYLVWQLRETITVFEPPDKANRKLGKATASITVSQPPPIIVPYPYNFV